MTLQPFELMQEGLFALRVVCAEMPRGGEIIWTSRQGDGVMMPRHCFPYRWTKEQKAEGPQE